MIAGLKDKWNSHHCHLPGRPGTGGTLSGEHGIGLLKAPFLKAELGDDGLAVMGGIKRTLDPGNILNPGKVFPGPV
ncbi:FAD-binding oxidoreductase [Moorella sp. Hama-1]|uniref:FAD-binding oxidoreductase n=1 Tax=Moorella sp. Hama-1 TaxID=2138101 RepID=UPI0019133C53|nr:FAD-linked oxidase C-terminal domain-containing protein [Moorella sp. Hama-1]MDN5362718.1 glycolate oxidase [Moorella sp. (in: firmicutes)]BCV22771.1 hypothetical protein hamaS1_28400 [Moorella sp. Hama-1]